VTLFDELAALAPADRLRAVLRVINRVHDEPALLLREIPPAAAVAAVAVVAVSLRADLPWADDRLRAATIPGPLPVETPMLALACLDVIVGRDPAAVHTHLAVDDGDAATALLDDLRQVLVAGIRELAGLH
jgi:hypothetical protein